MEALARVDVVSIEVDLSLADVVGEVTNVEVSH